MADPKLEIARKLRFEPGHTALLIVDAQGRLIGGFALDESKELDPLYAAELRRVLYLRQTDALVPELMLQVAAWNTRGWPRPEVVLVTGSALAADGGYTAGRDHGTTLLMGL